MNNCRERTKRRLENGSGTRDLFYYLVRTVLIFPCWLVLSRPIAQNREDAPDEAPPPLEQLADDGILAMAAGSDTTASALGSLFYCLVAYPDVQDKLRAEVDKFYPSGTDATNSVHHGDMPYLTAVINEALRLFPPVPGCTQREESRDGQGTMFRDMCATFPEPCLCCNWLISCARI